MAEQLEKKVSELIEIYNPSSFRKYWQLYKEAFNVTEVGAFFIKVQPETSYMNVAIIGDGLVIDVEGSDDPEEGAVSAHPLRDIRSIYFRTQALPTLSRSRNASLIVITHLVGTTGGPYWMAESSTEEKELLAFSRKLAELIKSS